MRFTVKGKDSAAVNLWTLNIQFSGPFKPH